MLSAENDNIKKACAFTGHRPFRFIFRYDEKHWLCLTIKAAMADACRVLYEKHGVRFFYSGCALGVDQWGAEAVLALREEYPDIRLICAAPFPDFVSRWSEDQRKRLRRIWDASDDRGFVCREYQSEIYYKRNRFIVDRSAYLVAVYDKAASPSGGTHMTVQYAQALRRTILFIEPASGKICK